MAAAYLDASEFASLDFSHEDSPAGFDYPTPAASSDADTTPVKDEPSKKKRKAWGQPVPEIVPILPPRKRAKTAEEKEQRKNERILRNRRAADKSRQRQKAQQAELEQQNKNLIAENAQLKELLAKAGLLSQFTFTPPAPSSEASSSPEEPQKPGKSPKQEQEQEQQPQPHQPVLSEPTPPPSVYHASPSLAPQLDLEHGSDVSGPVLDSGMTQYPAVVLCDLQCQPILDRKLGLLSPVPLVNTILTLLHYLTIATTCSPSTHSQITSLFQTLEQALATTSAQLESIVLNNFPLIHILISMPSTSTQPAIFRIKLLSRLLACNPSLAPHLMMAADRALQQKLAEGDWTADDASRWTVSSLMTIKWSIRWLAKEHSNIRMQYRSGKVDQEYLYRKGQSGVDVGAIGAKYRLFDKLDPELRLDVVPAKTSVLVELDRSSLSLRNE